MNNKLKSFKVVREITTFEQVTIKAHDEADVWERMDKHQLEDGKEYNWKPYLPKSKIAEVTYTILNSE